MTVRNEFVLKHRTIVYEKISGSTAGKAELANVDGCFYLVRPTVTVKGSKECMQAYNAQGLSANR
jgi:hypothetical protein